MGPYSGQQSAQLATSTLSREIPSLLNSLPAARRSDYGPMTCSKSASSPAFFTHSRKVLSRSASVGEISTPSTLATDRRKNGRAQHRLLPRQSLLIALRMYPEPIQLLRGVHSGKCMIRKRLAQEIYLRRQNQTRIVPELRKGERVAIDTASLSRAYMRSSYASLLPRKPFVYSSVISTKTLGGPPSGFRISVTWTCL